ncbi:MAG: magnesium transporter [Kineosporiaceae bacterium]|nr:magnesium transporter [Kineosporiaceae bacterium]MBK7622666.1 magnesium transporter [Kineosporiaceae bacterium]MBK8078645.1 magnesium transporter [Kineosporiaceae bacterium]
MAVFDPLGDQVGLVRDVVVVSGAAATASPRAVGLVIEVPGHRQVFLPMTRVTSIQPGQLIITGLVNLRRFEQRVTETLVVDQLLGRRVQVRGSGEPVVVQDVAISLTRARQWRVSTIYVRHLPAGRAGAALAAVPGLARLTRRRGETELVDHTALDGLIPSAPDRATSDLLASLEDLRAAEAAEAVMDMPAEDRVRVTAALDVERLADVLEQLPEATQVEILASLRDDRAVEVLEAMQPDDAADLLGELSDEQAESLLALMDPGEAEDVRRLLAYDSDTAGGMMTTEPVILPPETTVAEALARVRRADLAPTLAIGVFVCRQPLETPTGSYLGMVHLQRMLREPPATPVGDILDTEVEPLDPTDRLTTITRHLATYDLVSVPVIDADGSLLGVVTVDDVLDHLLPEDWRTHDD